MQPSANPAEWASPASTGNAATSMLWTQQNQAAPPVAAPGAGGPGEYTLIMKTGSAPAPAAAPAAPLAAPLPAAPQSTFAPAAAPAAGKPKWLPLAIVANVIIVILIALVLYFMLRPK